MINKKQKTKTNGMTEYMRKKKLRPSSEGQQRQENSFDNPKREIKAQCNSERQDKGKGENKYDQEAA
jgi:hypothetical protein